MDYYASFVNLDSRTDRLQHMNTELNRVGLKAIRQRGIPWKETDYTNPKYQAMYTRTPGAIGCHLSQVEVMKKALEIGQHAFVMEDDIHFCEDFNKRMEYISEWSQRNEWDVIWLGASFHVNPPYWHPKGPSGMRPNCSANLGYDVWPTDDPRMVKTFGAYVTFAYIVNVHSIEKILTLFERDLWMSIGIDWLFIKLQPELQCFSFVPGCIMQIDNMSDIGKGMTVWSGQLKNGPYVFQEKMEDFNPHDYKFY